LLFWNCFCSCWFSSSLDKRRRLWKFKWRTTKYF